MELTVKLLKAINELKDSYGTHSLKDVIGNPFKVTHLSKHVINSLLYKGLIREFIIKGKDDYFYELTKLGETYVDYTD